MKWHDVRTRSLPIFFSFIPLPHPLDTTLTLMCSATQCSNSFSVQIINPAAIAYIKIQELERKKRLESLLLLVLSTLSLFLFPNSASIVIGINFESKSCIGHFSLLFLSYFLFLKESRCFTSDVIRLTGGSASLEACRPAGQPRYSRIQSSPTLRHSSVRPPVHPNAERELHAVYYRIIDRVRHQQSAQLEQLGGWREWHEEINTLLIHVRGGPRLPSSAVRWVNSRASFCSCHRRRCPKRKVYSPTAPWCSKSVECTRIKKERRRKESNKLCEHVMGWDKDGMADGGVAIVVDRTGPSYIQLYHLPSSYIL